MIEVKEQTLIIDGHAIGNEDEILAIIDKANCFDELKANFNGGDDL